MEHVDGRDLNTVAREAGQLAVGDAVEFALQTARGLEYAHQQGVIHRDIKPANLLLDSSGTVKILDMGLARFDDSVGESAAGAGLTQSGQIMGTVDYMPPEQAMDTRSADTRADIYSLGCTLFRLLSGKAPYDGDTMMKKLVAHREAPVPSLQATRSDVSPQLDAAVQRMMAKKPDERFASMTEVISALEAARPAKESPLRPPPRPLVASEPSLSDFLSSPAASQPPPGRETTGGGATLNSLPPLPAGSIPPFRLSQSASPPPAIDLAAPAPVSQSIAPAVSIQSQQPRYRRTKRSKISPLILLSAGGGVLALLLLGLLFWMLAGSRGGDADGDGADSVTQQPGTGGDRRSSSTRLLAGFGPGKTVALTKSNETVQITIDGQEFAVYRIGDHWPKPFFAPLRATDGTMVTRDVSNPTLLPEHRGVWMSFGDVDGVNFWAEEAKIENVSVNVVDPKGNPASMEIVNHWKTDSRTILVERTLVTVYANRLIEYETQLSGDSQAVMLGDCKEGLFGVRVAPQLSEEGGGRMINADGLRGEEACWGKTGDWVDFSGEIYGKTYGVTVMDHPSNPRRARYQLRGYGLLAANPLAASSLTDGTLSPAPLPLAANETFKLRYAVYVHDGDAAAGRVAEVYDAFRGISRGSAASSADGTWTSLFDGPQLARVAGGRRADQQLEDRRRRALLSARPTEQRFVYPAAL